LLVDQPCLPEMVARLQALRSLYDVRVKLLKSRTDNEPLVDVNDPDARIITFRPFYFSLGFKFLLSKLFKEVFCAMGCAPGQCTPNVYLATMCFENLSLRHFVRYAQVRVYKAKLFTVLVKGITLGMMTCWRSANDGKATYVTAHLFPSPIAMQLELGLDMAKVRRTLNIPLRFCEWRWLLSEYREEDSGLPPAEDVERWKHNGPDLDDLHGGQEEYSAESLSKRKAAAKSSRGEATSSHAKDGSPSRKKPRLPFAPSSSARVKHLMGVDNTKVGGMRGIRGVLPEPPADTLENHDMFREQVVPDLVLSSVKEMQTFLLKVRVACIGQRWRSKRRSAHDPALLTPLEMKLERVICPG
ncbi:Plant protein of unknown function D, partial [Prunus dulcis]